jgi:ABC-type lipoprotein export system ATPase subunit
MFKTRDTQPLPIAHDHDNNSSVLIDLRHVLKVYQTPAGGFTALKNVDLQVNAGEFVAVIGKSGSGKSTLINMITGIDRPTQGEVIVGRQPIHNLSEDQIARWRGENLGVIFQFFQLLPTLTVIENVMLPMELRQTYGRGERRERAMHLLEQVELADQANKFPSAISGGQQQRVAIARALANEPSVIVGDEPTGSLDSKTADSIFRLFERFVEQGRTVLIVTHDRELASRIPRVVFIADGEITDQHVASALPELARNELAQVLSQLEPIKFSAGQVIIRQGEEADSFYIIVRGMVDVILRHPTGTEVLTAQLQAGHYFGEIGLLEGGVRTATVKASEDNDVIVMQLSRDRFAELLDNSDMTREQLIHLMRKRVMEQHITEVLPVLLPEQLDRVMAHISVIDYAAGERVIERGDPVETLLIVVEGRAAILNEQEETIREIGVGESFGEQVMSRGKYTLSLQAIDDLTLIAIPNEVLETISVELTEDSLSEILSRRYLEATVGEFIPNLQRRKRNIDVDFDD